MPQNSPPPYTNVKDPITQLSASTPLQCWSLNLAFGGLASDSILDVVHKTQPSDTFLQSPAYSSSAKGKGKEKVITKAATTPAISILRGDDDLLHKTPQASWMLMQSDCLLHTDSRVGCCSDSYSRHLRYQETQHLHCASAKPPVLCSSSILSVLPQMREPRAD